MNPEEKLEFEALKKLVESLLRVENVSFIENGKRRIAKPLLGEGMQKQSTGDTSGVLSVVDESGSASYAVAKEYTGTITLLAADGNTYKIGYY